MNAKQAKQIDLSQLLEKLGIHPVRTKGNDLWYLSPLRQERTASFHVNTNKNTWFDHGADIGGDVAAFACAYLQSCGEDHTVADGLRWLRNLFKTHEFQITESVRESFKDAHSNLEIKSITRLYQRKPLAYLKSRGIPESIGKKYLKQAYVFNRLTKKHFYALAFKNMDKGYELRNPKIKSCLAPKAITFIRGDDPMSADIHVFEGFMDFLSLLAIEKKETLKSDTIILNSLSCLRLAFPFIANYHYKNLYTWMDNDAAGKSATLRLDEFAQKEHLAHRPMNKIYTPHKDVNAWHMDQLKLQDPT